MEIISLLLKGEGLGARFTRYFIGFDVGSTKSHAAIADENGRVVGFGEGGPGNPKAIGYDAFCESVRDLTTQAIAEAGIAGNDIAGVGFGIGGYDWDSERSKVMNAIAPIGFSAPIALVNDAALGILAGTLEGWGIAVVSGSGCNCRGWDRARARQGGVTGYGTLLAEGAGASETLFKMVQAVALEWTRRGPVTRLTPLLIEYTASRDIADLLEGLSTRRYSLPGDAARLVFRAAAEGDAVAQDLVVWIGRELSSLAIGVIHQLEFEALEFEIVLIGSFFNGSPVITETMCDMIRAVAPGARLVRFEKPPVVGAILLAMEQARFDWLPVRGNVIQSLAALRSKLKSDRGDGNLTAYLPSPPF